MKTYLITISVLVLLDWLPLIGATALGDTPQTEEKGISQKRANPDQALINGQTELECLTEIRLTTDRTIAELHATLKKPKADEEAAIAGKRVNELEQQCALSLLRARITYAEANHDSVLAAQLTTELHRLEDLLTPRPPTSHCDSEIAAKAEVESSIPPAEEGIAESEVLITRPSEPIAIESQMGPPANRKEVKN